MTRWEYIDKDGTLSDKQTDKTVAKMSINVEHKTNRFYALISGGEMFDPQNTSMTYIKRRVWKFRLIKEEAYFLYLRYLGYPDKKSLGQKLFKTHAERMI